MASVTELMGQCVWDPNGLWVGHVVDIRVIKHRGELQQSATIYGLVVSANRGPVLLTLTRDRHGRWSWLSQLLTRVVYVRSAFVPWSCVTDHGDGEVHISTAKKELTRV
jgi:sporulation protein YlmC with PRC-barrel domain